MKVRKPLSAIFFTFVVTIAAAFLSSSPAAAAGGPRIDVYVADGYGTAPCVRNELDGGAGVRYFCRQLSYESVGYISGAVSWVYVEPGEISGGGDYSVLMDTGTHLEGCTPPSPTGTNFTCSARAYQMDIQDFSTNGWLLYGDAFVSWAQNQYTAATCVYAIYSREPVDIGNDCQP